MNQGGLFGTGCRNIDYHHERASHHLRGKESRQRNEKIDGRFHSHRFGAGDVAAGRRTAFRRGPGPYSEFFSCDHSFRSGRVFSGGCNLHESSGFSAGCCFSAQEIVFHHRFSTGCFCGYHFPADNGNPTILIECLFASGGRRK